jgi:arylsulfatase A-like enzyme
MPSLARARPSRGGLPLLLSAAVACLAWLLASAPDARAADRPNILIILTDDQRAGLSVMPFTTEWFRAGTRYTNAFVNTPLCCPARASIMTGRYAHNNGVVNNQSVQNLNHDTTIQKQLHDAGYRTAYFGKFLNRWELTAAPPNFDRWATFSNRLNGELFITNGYYGDPWNVDGNVVQVDSYSTRFIGTRAVRFLDAQEAADDVPWLLFIAPFAPHTPAIAEPRYADAYIRPWRGNPATAETDLSDKPPWWQRRSFSLTKGAALRARQFRTLMSVDVLVRRVANRLTALGEDRSTLAFFMSDNGYLWSEHGRKGKTFPYEGSVRVPMLARWPRHVPAGIDDRLVAHVDVAPTIEAAAGLPPNPSGPMDGHSLLDLAWSRSRLLLEYFPSADSRTPGWASTWTGDLQYTEYYAPDTGDVSFRELYNLIGDRWQLDNLYADRNRTNDPSAVETASMSEQLARDRVCVGTACP